jgi:hypothetical protein
MLAKGLRLGIARLDKAFSFEVKTRFSLLMSSFQDGIFSERKHKN